MKIAVTSQNRREITGHAGRCRNFRVYGIEAMQAQPDILAVLGNLQEAFPQRHLRAFQRCAASRG